MQVHGQQTNGLTAEEQKRFDYYYLESVNQKLKQNYTTAYELLQHCLAINPHSSAAYYELSQYYLYLKQNKLGIEALEKAVEYAPDNYWYGQGLANLYMQQDEMDKAVNLLETMCKQFPQRRELLLTLESVYARAEDYDKVIGVLDRLEEQMGKNEQISMEKFRVYLQKKDEQKALKEIEELIAQYPNELRYQVVLGDAYLQLGKENKAYELYQKVLKAEPDNAQAMYSLASYYELTDQTEQYNRQLDSLLLNHKVDSNVKLNVMRRYIVQAERDGRDSTQIINQFEKILKQDTENDQMTMLYVQYLLAKNMKKESHPVLYRLLEIDPTNSAGRLMLLQDAVSDEDVNEIINICEGGVTATPEVLQFYYYLAYGYLQTDRLDEVLTTCQHALEHVADDTSPEVISDFYGMQGDVYHQQSKNHEAYEAYDKALEYNPQNIGALNNYAYYLSLDKVNLDKAEEMSYTTIKAEPENGTYLDTYAWVLFVKGNYTQAKLYIDMALKAGGEVSADVVEHCGDIYYKNGDVEGAVKYWKQALEMGSKSDTLQRKINKKQYIE